MCKFVVYISHKKNSNRHLMNDDDMFALLHNDTSLYTAAGKCLINADLIARPGNLNQIL